MKFAEYDKVSLVVDRPDIGLRKGASGTVLGSSAEHDDYLVEFGDSDGITIFMGAILSDQLQPYSKSAQA